MFWHSFVAEARHVRHCAWDLALVSWVPLLALAALLLLFSQSITLQLPIALVDQDHTGLSRQVAQTLSAAPTVKVLTQPPTLAAAQSLVRSGKVFAIVYIPANAERDALRGDNAHIYTFYNNSFYTAGSAVDRALGSAISQLNTDLSPARLLQTHEADKSPQAALPVRMQVVSLFNAPLSYQMGLVPIIFSCLTSLIMMCTLTGALARGYAAGQCGWQNISGQMAFYVLAYSAVHGSGLLALSGWSGWALTGTSWAILPGLLLMYCAYALIALLFVGISKGDALRALSLCSLFAGPALAYSDGLFPTLKGATFVQVWSLMMPITTFLKLQSQSLFVGAPLHAMLGHFGGLALFVIILLLPAYAALSKAAAARSTS